MKQVVITGVSSGIGQATARAFRAAGWQVSGLSHAEMDLANTAATAQKAAELAERLTHIDALIHVAGIWHDADKAFSNRDLEDYTPAEIVRTMHVGLTSFMLLAAALLPKLKKDGAVVGVSGTFGDGASGWLPYYTSKRGLEDFLVGLAQDYPSGPRVYAVSPADTATPAYKKFFPEYIEEAQPAERVAELLLALVEGKTPYASGDVVEIRAGKHAKHYHA